MDVESGYPARMGLRDSEVRLMVSLGIGSKY